MRVCLPVVAALLLILPAARVQAQADVSIASSAFSNGQPGGPILYFLSVRNSGPGAATNVTLSNAIPPNTTFIAEDHPAGSTCSSAVVCMMPAVASGATELFFIEVEIDETAPSGTIISNTATVSSAGDPNSANNSATSATTVAGPIYVKAD